MSFFGPIYDQADEVLHDCKFYQNYRNKTGSWDSYAKGLDQMQNHLIDAGLSPKDLPFLKRRPADDRACVDKILIQLQKIFMIPDVKWNKEEFINVAETMGKNFTHGSYRTYIASEEALLLFVLVQVLKPKRIAFLGSYYGYWAFWVLPVLAQYGGQAVLIDIDEKTSHLASQNIKKFNYGNVCTVVNDDARTWMALSDQPFDMLVIDAECPDDHSEPTCRGKRVYAPILRASIDALNPGGWVVCHNIILEQSKKLEEFEPIIEKNRAEYRDFLAIVEDKLVGFDQYETTEGIGIAQRPNG